MGVRHYRLPMVTGLTGQDSVYVCCVVVDGCPKKGSITRRSKLKENLALNWVARPLVLPGYPTLLCGLVGF